MSCRLPACLVAHVRHAVSPAPSAYHSSGEVESITLAVAQAEVQATEGLLPSALPALHQVRVALAQGCEGSRRVGCAGMLPAHCRSLIPLL